MHAASANGVTLRRSGISAPSPSGRGSQMKVVIAVPDFTKNVTGGIPNYYRKLRPHMTCDASFFIIGRRAGESVRALSLPRLLHDYWCFFRAVERSACDLVVLNPSLERRSLLREALFLLLAKARGIPAIVFFRGWEPELAARIGKRWRPLFRRVYGTADLVIVLAEEFRKTLRGWGIEAPIVLESTTVEDEAFAAAGTGKMAAVATEAGACTVLFLSRLLKAKGIYVAIEAHRLARKEQPGITLIIAGDGPELESAQAYVAAERVEGVRFTGFVRGAAREELYRSADIFLLPTQHGEGMPNTVIEAMAYGVPVITRPVGGLNDFFTNGVMGYVTESCEPEVFAKLIGKLASEPDLRRRIGEYNRSYAEQHFRASSVAARLQEHFSDLVAKRPYIEAESWFERARPK